MLPDTGTSRRPAQTPRVIPLIERASQESALVRLLSLDATPLGPLIGFGVVWRLATHRTSPLQLLNVTLTTPIAELMRCVRSACLQRSHLPHEMIRDSCEKLLVCARRPVGAFLQGAQRHHLPAALLPRLLGETVLQDYLQGNMAHLDRWQHTLTQAQVLSYAMRGDTGAFEVLCTVYKHTVLRAVQARVWHDKEAEDIAQETWCQIWQKLDTYDPAVGTFPAFARACAKIMVLRCPGKRWRYLETGDVPDVAQVLENMEDVLARGRLYERTLQVTFASGSPPHQLLAFGLCKLLEWKPEAIVTRVFDTPLRKLATQFELAYLTAVSPPPSRAGILRASLAPLHAVMNRPLHEVRLDQKTRQLHTDLLGCMVGETTLRQYYESARKIAAAAAEQIPTPQAKVTQWWHAVTRRVSRDPRLSADGAL